MEDVKYVYQPNGHVNKDLSDQLDADFKENIESIVHNIAKHVADENYDLYQLLKYISNEIQFEVVSEIHSRQK